MKTFDSNNLPDGFPNDGIQMIQRKPYITHVGLVWLANHRGKPWSSTIDNIERTYGDDGWPFYVEVTVTITDGECSHTALGDASRLNVGKNIVPHFVRMAHTRAMNRALRAFVGYAGCTADELGHYDSDNGGSNYQSDPVNRNRSQQQASAGRAFGEANSSDGQNRGPQKSQSGDPSCPHCGAMVYDNRETAKGSQPLFVCSARERWSGAKKKGDRVYGWSSWDPDWLDKEMRHLAADADDSRKIAPSNVNGLLDDVAQGIGSAYHDTQNDRDERGEFFNDDPMPF